MDHLGMTKRVRIDPTLMQQLRTRMKELGYHADQYMHLGPLTWLFTHREWIMVSRQGHGRSALYPPDKTMNDVVSELEQWSDPGI